MALFLTHNGLMHFWSKVKPMIDSKSESTELNSHTNNSTVHITSSERTSWNGKTTVVSSSTNGNIKINNAEVTVYTHPSGTNPHGTTKSDIGLSNVDNTADANKSVNYANSSGNSDTVDGWHMQLGVSDWGIKPMSGGTGDLQAGVTTLSKGHIYFVYE